MNRAVSRQAPAAVSIRADMGQVAAAAAVFGVISGPPFVETVGPCAERLFGCFLRPHEAFVFAAEFLHPVNRK
jgi:hypothetical protein